MNVFKKMGLKEVINANGKMTILGVSTPSDNVADNMKVALQNFVIMDELIDYTGKMIANKTGAQDGCPTIGAASGIAIAVASIVAGTDLRKIESIPFLEGTANEIIIQKGHVVNFGGNIAQMIRIGGGCPVEVGCSNKVEEQHIEGAINENTAALFYVKSHHAVQKGMQSLENMIRLSQKHNLPIIVDAAAEEDLKQYVALGADLVIYSGGKALEGPTSGFICGRNHFIRACKKQYKGIGRAMKVSKEAMVGLITALENYNPDLPDIDAQKNKMLFICNRLNEVNGLTCKLEQDEAGRDIYRAKIKVNEKETGVSASDINKHLKSGDPAIYLRDHYVNIGILMVDPRALFQDQEAIIVDAIKKQIKGAKSYV